MAAGSYGGNSGNPATRSVDTHKQPTVRDNGTNPSNKHWKTKNAGSSMPTIGTTKGGRGASTGPVTEHLNAGATKRFGGKPVGKLGMVGY